MEEGIKNIFNTVWKMYRAFQSDHNMIEYNNQIKALSDKYSDNPALLSFCQSQIIAFAPFINQMMKDYKENASCK